MLFNHGRGALGKAVRQRSPRFIASTNLICRTLRAAALRQLSVPTPPIAYGNLRGEWSLVDCDPIWAVLLSPDAAPGLSFVTTAVTGADIATGLTFPNGRGLHVPLTFDDGTTTFTLQAVFSVRVRVRLRMLIKTPNPNPNPSPNPNPNPNPNLRRARSYVSSAGPRTRSASTPSFRQPSSPSTCLRLRPCGSRRSFSYPNPSPSPSPNPNSNRTLALIRIHP